jgi:hypothetical protein
VINHSLIVFKPYCARDNEHVILHTVVVLNAWSYLPWHGHVVLYTVARAHGTLYGSQATFLVRPLQRENGIILLHDVYCLYNTVRGTVSGSVYCLNSTASSFSFHLHLLSLTFRFNCIAVHVHCCILHSFTRICCHLLLRSLALPFTSVAGTSLTTLYWLLHFLCSCRSLAFAQDLVSPKDLLDACEPVTKRQRGNPSDFFWRILDVDLRTLPPDSGVTNQ